MTPVMAARIVALTGENPSSAANGVNGRTAPPATTASAADASTAPGLLRQTGLRRVRTRKMTSVWVARDSTNHDARKSVGLVWLVFCCCLFFFWLFFVLCC